MPRANIEPADQATEHYRQLIRQNQDFVVRLRTAIETGAESAAAVTASVRTRREGKPFRLSRCEPQEKGPLAIRD